MKKYIMPLLAATAVIAYCVLQASRDTAHPESHGLEFRNFLEQPDDITCGPTSAAMLLSYYGKSATPREVAVRTRTKWFRWDGEDVGMTAPMYVAVALGHFGVPSTVRRGGVENLKHFISTGRPPVVLVRSGNTTWHYVVAFAYTADQFVVADPGGGARREMSAGDFLGAWRFTHDMGGNLCGLACPACGGAGRCGLCWGGPFDPLRDLLRAGGVYDQTMIVPDNKREDDI